METDANHAWRLRCNYPISFISGARFLDAIDYFNGTTFEAYTDSMGPDPFMMYWNDSMSENIKTVGCICTTMNYGIGGSRYFALGW